LARNSRSKGKRTGAEKKTEEQNSGKTPHEERWKSSAASTRKSVKSPPLPNLEYMLLARQAVIFSKMNFGVDRIGAKSRLEVSEHRCCDLIAGKRSSIRLIA
jgi:hypothetical protein